MAEQKVIGTGSLDVRVVTPRGTAATAETDAVTAPGELGEFEVLPGHIPFLTSLHPGVLILGEKGRRSFFAVGPGFLRVNEGGDVDVLVEQAVAGDKVDLDEAQRDKADAAKALEGWSKAQDAEWRNLTTRLEWAQARLDAHARSR